MPDGNAPLSEISSPPPPLMDEAGVTRVLEALRAARGLDFRQYRPSTIRRRLERRMAAVRAADTDEYFQLLSSSAAEFDHLVDYLTLKVSAFFRDARAFDLLRGVIVPEMEQRSRREGRGARVWSAGCAMGEEVYSLAMVLLEACDERCAHARHWVLGTDIDGGALAVARAGLYRPMQMQGVPEATLQRWFTPAEPNGTWRVSALLQDATEFRFHDLVAQPSRLPTALAEEPCDLVLCCNVLIYMQRPLQLSTLALLDAGLAPGGYLVLGEAETLLEPYNRRYVSLDRRARVFRKLESTDR